jgi:hemoglobin
MNTIFDSAGGREGMLRLASAWHDRAIADDIVSHAFSHGFRPDHTLRIAAYWGEALGGPSDYTEHYGSESSVVRQHSGNGVHDDMDDRAIACFDQAVTDVGLDANPRLAAALHDYFASMTRGAMATYPESADDVPEALPLPHWSWNGPLESA